MRRKIAFISEHASPLAALGGVDSGGQNVYVGQLAKHLAALGYQIDIFTRCDDERMPRIIDWSPGVKVIHIKAGPVKFIKKEKLYPYMDEFTENMIQYFHIHGNGYQMIHANFWMSAYVAMKLKKREKIPYVITFHALGLIRRKYQGSNDGFPDERFSIETETIQNADAVIAECPQDKKDLMECYGADVKKIHIIPCGFDPNEFHPMDKLLARLALNLDPKEQIILQLGRMVPRKGIDNVIAAASKLIHEYGIPVKLLIVGGESDQPDPKITPEIGRLQKIAKKERISKQILFLGRSDREKLKFYYNAADIFVTTPWYEPFGITPLEAMACGTPVVGSDVGGIKYSIVDKKTGYLVPPNEPLSLAFKLKEILSNSKLAHFYSENSIRRVNDLFTWTKVADTMASLYEAILSPLNFEDYGSRLGIIDESFDSAIKTIQKTKNSLRIPILDSAWAIGRSLYQGGKILICGNGGSAADASHFAGELVGRFVLPNRNGLPAVSLSADPSILTAWGNDFGFESIFSRQVEALGCPGDVLIGISTSGESENVIQACQAARQKNMICIGLLGKTGGRMKDLVDISMVIPSDNTQRIQELHINIIHTICSLVEKQLFVQNDSDRDIAYPALWNVRMHGQPLKSIKFN